MRVAWDMQAVTGPKPTGLGVSVRLLYDALTAHAPDVEVVGLRPNQRDAPLSGVLDRVLWEQWRLPRAVAREHAARPLDLLYSPALGAPLRSCRGGQRPPAFTGRTPVPPQDTGGTPVPPQDTGRMPVAPANAGAHCAPLPVGPDCVPVIAHVHDLIALRYPRQFTGAAGVYWKRLLPAGWRRCRALTVSNASLVDEVADRLPYPRERIHVVPYYADGRIAAAAQAIWDGTVPAPPRPFANLPYFTVLASCEPRKNIALAIEALALLAARGREAGLLCIGGITAYTAELLRLAERRKVLHLIEFAGYLPRAEVAASLLSCVALVFVSRYEGYGMPPQEAQSIGCPVILSDIPCHRAVYGDRARLALLPADQREFPPFIGVDDAEALAGAMLELMDDAQWRRRLAQAGRAYTATFTPQATAAALREAFMAASG